MRLLWEDRAWSDYLYWQTQDKKTLKRINGLIKDIQRSTFEGIGKPEPLKENLSGMWSRRIDDTNRIVYYEKDEIMILSRLVDTFISRISLTMLPVPNPHNTVCVLSWEEARHWQSRSSGYSSS